MTAASPPARRGHLFVVAAPSGAGKTSLVNALLQRRPNLRASISHTTRPPRSHEQHGREYYFVMPAEFERLVGANAFLEHANVFDYRYGTGREPLERLLAAGHDVILEIDWQGARQVRERMPECTTIFILPPSRAELERRLRNRRTDSEAVIARRLRDAVEDMSHWPEFDYVVVNDDFDAAVGALGQIVDREGGAWTSRRAELATLGAALIS
jgi:guanylate kinase